jgi:RNA polymerase sigma-70 factor (ECF subfamily)
MTVEQTIETPVLTDQQFKAKLKEVTPHLRAFGRSLSGNPDSADDLVQETMLKAWGSRMRFQAGTNFKAWCFTILRNHYYSQIRRRRFVGEWDDLTAERILSAPASQDASIDLRDFLRALQQIPAPQREALILVGAGGLSYEEVSDITQVALGTVKSRVARARTALEAILAGGLLDVRRCDVGAEGDPVVSILAYLEKVQIRHGISFQPTLIAA